jgi:hypothetical protein
MSEVTLADLRKEMARLTGVMMAKNALYLKREQEIIDEFGHDKLKMAARLDDDKALRDASGAAKMCATLAGAMAAVIQAELAYERRYRKTSNIVDMSPNLREALGGNSKPCICGAEGTTHLSHTYVCRNQI